MKFSILVRDQNVFKCRNGRDIEGTNGFLLREKNMKKTSRRKKASTMSVSDITKEENRCQTATDVTIKITREQKKKEANEPLYLIRYE
jgi:hypothetical protein